jgi:hypothetical protein
LFSHSTPFQNAAVANRAGNGQNLGRGQHPYRRPQIKEINAVRCAI